MFKISIKKVQLNDTIIYEGGLPLIGWQNKDKVIDKVTEFTMFVYNKGQLKPEVDTYHYSLSNKDWIFDKKISWDTYIASKRILTT